MITIGHGRLWPNRFWPALLADRVWPNRFWVCVFGGMADFGQNRLWPKPTLAKPSLTCCVWCVVCLCVCVCVLAVWRGCWFHGFIVWVSRVGVGFKVLVWACSVPPDRPSQDRPSQDRPSQDRPSQDRPSPGPPQISLFFFPLWGSSRGIFGGVFEGRDSQMCTLGLSGCRVKPRRLCRFGTEQGPGRDAEQPRRVKAEKQRRSSEKNTSWTGTAKGA